MRRKLTGVCGAAMAVVSLASCTASSEATATPGHVTVDVERGTGAAVEPTGREGMQGPGCDIS